MTRQVNPETLELIKRWEGFVGYAYDDADPSIPKRRIGPTDKVRGILTIGYGHTGRDVKPGAEMSEEAATFCLLRDLEQYEQAVETAVKVPLSDNQFGALVSFCYNVGPGNFQRSTLLKLLNQGNYDAVPAQLMRWTQGNNDNQRAGLTNRRAAEAGLWARGSFVAGAAIDVLPQPSAAGKHIAAAATAGVAAPPAIATVVSAISDSSYQISQAQYWLSQHSWLGYVVGGALLIGVGWLVWTAIKGRL